MLRRSLRVATENVRMRTWTFATRPILPTIVACKKVRHRLV
jgi:hypothetical protein